MKNATTKNTKTAAARKLTRGFATAPAANETPMSMKEAKKLFALNEKAVAAEKKAAKAKKMTAREKADLIAANETARAAAPKVGAAAHDFMKRTDFHTGPSTAPISAATAKANEKATAATKAQLKAAKKAAAPKADQATELAIHINPSGRVCFGKLAAARIGDLGFMKLIDRGTEGFRMIATATETETPIRSANGRPYITATKELKAAGLFDGTAADLIAQPYNSHGFDLMA